VNQFLMKAKPVDFEELGYQTMLACGEEERAITICGLHLHAYANQLQPELSTLHSESSKQEPWFCPACSSL